MFQPISPNSPKTISYQHSETMSQGTVVYFKHSNPLNFLDQATKLIDLLSKWGYDNMLPSDLFDESKPHQIGTYSEIGVNGYKCFSDLSLLSKNIDSIRQIEMYFKRGKSDLRITAIYSLTTSGWTKGDCHPIWKLEFSEIDLSPGMAVCNTDLTRLGSSLYYTMEELLLTYNLIKAIYLGLGFDLAAASREEEGYAYGEQQGSDPYCAYDGLMRLDRHGANRLIVPYEEGRRIVSSDTDHNTQTGMNFRAEYDHPVPIIVREPPYNIGK